MFRPSGVSDWNDVSPMTSVEQWRERVREHNKPRPRRRVWHPPTLDDFAFGVCLNFDQTLSKTGWSLVRSADGLTVADSGTLGGIVEAQGFDGTFVKGLRVFYEMDELLLAYGEEVDVIVHEMPSVHGFRTESSLLAAYALRLAADQRDLTDKIVMISRQRAFANIVGPKEYLKKYVTEAVNDLVPPERRQGDRWNQDVHDSVLLGLQWLHERKGEGDG